MILVSTNENVGFTQIIGVTDPLYQLPAQTFLSDAPFFSYTLSVDRQLNSCVKLCYHIRFLDKFKEVIGGIRLLHSTYIFDVANTCIKEVIESTI